MLPDLLPIDRSFASPNHGTRAERYPEPDSLVLHYTGMRDGPSAVAWLCDPASQVSSHYVVAEDGAVLGLVDEERRAWHAGRSSWRGETDMNSASIGIEIVNGGHDFGLPAFPAAQIEAVVALCRMLMRRYAIAAERVLAHSDIAPGRKRDPGERFPWATLARAGVGLWPDPLDLGLQGDAAPWSARAVQRGLLALGYGVAITDAFDAGTESVLRAFQRRYRPSRVDGVADLDTTARLDALLRLSATAP